MTSYILWDLVTVDPRRLQLDFDKAVQAIRRASRDGAVLGPREAESAKWIAFGAAAAVPLVDDLRGLGLGWRLFDNSIDANDNMREVVDRRRWRNLVIVTADVEWSCEMQRLAKADPRATLVLVHPSEPDAYARPAELRRAGVKLLSIRGCMNDTPRAAEPERTQEFWTSVKVSGEAVAVDELVRNGQVEHLLRNPTHQGRWCQDSRPHEAMNCQFVHRKDGSPPPLSPPSLQEREPGVRCGFGSAVRGGDCQRTANIVTTVGGVLKKLPADVLVSVGRKPVPIGKLVRSNAVGYLVDNPGRNGSWCNNIREHDPLQCNFIHPVTDSQGHGIAATREAETRTAHLPTAHLRCVAADSSSSDGDGDRRLDGSAYCGVMHRGTRWSRTW